MWLWSHWDTIHHHYRRYSRRSFRDLLTRPNLRIEVLSYANSALFPVAASVRMYQRMTGVKDDKAAMQVPAAPVNWMLKTVYSNERHLLGRLPMPFGLSVVAVARKV